MALVFVAPRFVVAILAFRCAGIARCIVATSQPAILAHAKAGHECCEGCHGLWLFLAEMSGKPFVTMLCLKATRVRHPDSQQFVSFWLGTGSKISWLTLRAVGLCDLDHQHPVVAHKCPGSCQGMRLPGSPNSRWSLPASCSAMTSRSL